MAALKFSWSYLPNVITAIRMAAVVPLTWLLVEQAYGSALVVAFLAGISDAVDGFLAKRFNWTSDLGGILDPLADKLLLLSCFFVLGSQGWLPVWLLLLVLGRDLLIVAGGLAYHYWIRPFTAEPLLISKINTFLQILLVLLLLLDLGWWQIPDQWHTIVLWSVTVSTALSGLQYVLLWGYRAVTENPSSQQESITPTQQTGKHD